jgi:hypothetical protein
LSFWYASFFERLNEFVGIECNGCHAVKFFCFSRLYTVRHLLEREDFLREHVRVL